MGVQLLGVLDVANGQRVELLEPAAAGGVEREEDGPEDEAAGEADVPQHLDEAEEEEAVQGAVVEDKGIGDLEEGYDPVDPAGREGGTRQPADAGEHGTYTSRGHAIMKPTRVP